jgi:hypothetical protein
MTFKFLAFQAATSYGSAINKSGPDALPGSSPHGAAKLACSAEMNPVFWGE